MTKKIKSAIEKNPEIIENEKLETQLSKLFAKYKKNISDANELNLLRPQILKLLNAEIQDGKNFQLPVDDSGDINFDNRLRDITNKEKEIHTEENEILNKTTTDIDATKKEIEKLEKERAGLIKKFLEACNLESKFEDPGETDFLIYSPKEELLRLIEKFQKIDNKKTKNFLLKDIKKKLGVEKINEEILQNTKIKEIRTFLDEITNEKDDNKKKEEVQKFLEKIGAKNKINKTKAAVIMAICATLGISGIGYKYFSGGDEDLFGPDNDEPEIKKVEKISPEEAQKFLNSTITSFYQSEENIILVNSEEKTMSFPIAKYTMTNNTARFFVNNEEYGIFDQKDGTFFVGPVQ